MILSEFTRIVLSECTRSVFEDLLRRILVDDPAQRARVCDIQSHKWMCNVYPQDGTENDHQLLKRTA